MRIKKIRLKNGYKRFYDLTIDLGPNPARIVALVGPNGCGKSSVLDGLMFRQRSAHPIGTQTPYDPNYHSMNPAVERYVNDVEIDFVEGKFEEAIRRRTAAGKPNTLLSFRSPYRYNTSLKIKSISATTPIDKNDYGAALASALDSKMEQNYRRLHAMINTYMEQHDVRPSEARAKIIGELNASIEVCLDLKIRSVGNVEGGKGTLFFSKPDHPGDIEFNVLSSGEKEVVDLLLDVYLRREDYEDSIFLFDEPELHINTAIQANLLQEIDRLIGDDCQIILTTHSIGFLRALQTQFRDRCQIVQFRQDMNLASQACTLTPIKPSPAAWRDLLAVALTDLATLVSPKTIIYCEGRDAPGTAGRERGMDAQALNTIFGNSRPDAFFVSSGGNTELDQRSAVALAVLGKVFPDVEVLVFKDRDMASGKPVSESDRLLYLETNPANHRVMKRFELENYLFDSDVLKSYCAAKGLEFDEPAYNALVTDIVHQQVKEETGKIKSICGIKTSINPEKFKLALAEYLTEDMPAFQELRECIFERR